VDGLEVLKNIKTNPDLRAIPVVILTTSKAETDVIKAYDLHANSYLVKPVDFTQFAELMETFDFYWLVWNQRPNIGPKHPNE
jgi:CheY-like chemotaxis protein